MSGFSKLNTDYKCPKCGNTSIEYDYGRRKAVCAKCGTPLSNFTRDTPARVADSS